MTSLHNTLFRQNRGPQRVRLMRVPGGWGMSMMESPASISGVVYVLLYAKP